MLTRYLVQEASSPNQAISGLKVFDQAACMPAVGTHISNLTPSLMIALWQEIAVL